MDEDIAILEQDGISVTGLELGTALVSFYYLVENWLELVHCTVHSD